MRLEAHINVGNNPHALKRVKLVKEFQHVILPLQRIRRFIGKFRNTRESFLETWGGD